MPLPDWDQFGDDFVLGLKAAVAMFVWWLPFLAIFVTLICLSIPVFIASGSENGAVAVPLTLISTVGWMGMSLVSIVFQVFILAVQPMVLGRIAVTGDLASGFQVSEIVREIRRVPVPLLIVIGLEYGIRSVSGFGILLCFVGVVFTTFAGSVLLSHLYGQLRRVVEESDGAMPSSVMPA